MLRDGADMVIMVQALAHKRYRIDAGANLAENFPLQIATTTRAPFDQTLEIRDFGAATQLRRFYRAVVLP
jgi:hypothetical protein